MTMVGEKSNIQGMSVQNYVELSSKMHMCVSKVIRDTAKYHAPRAEIISRDSKKLTASQRWSGSISLIESGVKIGLLACLAAMPTWQNQINALSSVAENVSKGFQMKEQAQQSQYDHSLNTNKFGRDAGSSGDRALAEILRQMSDSASTVHRSFSEMIREMLRPI